MTDKEAMQMALETAEQIASADYRHWGELASLGEFERWARSRANHIAEALRARLAQPEPAECDGGQCGIGGYCKECPKPLVKLKEMLEVQGRDGTWNYDHYFHGMYNGMEVMLAVLEGREPVFREAPEKWLSKKEWVGLTKEELAEILEFHFHGAFSGRDFYEDIETRLKEKNL